MKKFVIVIVGLAMLGLGPAAVDAAGGWSWQLDVNSSYIWRGFNLNPDIKSATKPSSKPVIQPSATYSFGDSGFSLNLWTSFSFVDFDRTELDVTLSYDFKLSRNTDMSVGFINYAWLFVDNFSFKRNTTQEIYATISFSKAFLKPTFSAYYDFNLGDGLYLLAAVSHPVPLTRKITAELGGSLGYNDGQGIGDNSGFSDLNFNFSIPIPFDRTTVTFSVHYTIVLLDVLGDENYFWVGISIAL